jgi:hypothetical protein
MIGQICRGSILGDWIYDYVYYMKDPMNIVEIGTGGGLGSTKCIYDAIIDSQKKNCVVYSIELNFENYKEAVLNIPKIDNFYLIHGYVTDVMRHPSTFPSFLFRGYTKKDAEGWYNRDLLDYKLCGNVHHLLPEKIDLLILDGGPFSGMKEFNFLQDRCNYIILDDTMDIKNYEAYKIVLEHPNEYSVIINRPEDRNGFLICRRKK